MAQHSPSQALGQDLVLGEVWEQLPTSSGWLWRVSAVNKAATVPGTAWRCAEYSPGLLRAVLEWGRAECLCLGLSSLNADLFNYLQQNLHLQFTLTATAWFQHLEVPGGSKCSALQGFEYSCTLSTKSSCKNGGLGLRLNSSWNPAVQAELLFFNSTFSSLHPSFVSPTII